MSEPTLLDLRFKANALETPAAAELDLLSSILPELILLMQQYDEEQD